MIYTFSEVEASEAYEKWGCNCGPTALAFALQTSLDAAHKAIPPARSITLSGRHARRSGFPNCSDFHRFKGPTAANAYHKGHEDESKGITNDLRGSGRPAI